MSFLSSPHVQPRHAEMSGAVGNSTVTIVCVIIFLRRTPNLEHHKWPLITLT
jgi:hypothetical protein